MPEFGPRMLMLFRACYPEREVEEEFFASRVSEAATQFAQVIFGAGWKMIKVFESFDGKSAIVMAPNRRPFKVEYIVR